MLKSDGSTVASEITADSQFSLTLTALASGTVVVLTVTARNAAGAVPAFFERQPKLGAVGGQQREMKVTRRRVDNAGAGAPARGVQMVDESRPPGKSRVRRGNDR